MNPMLLCNLMEEINEWMNEWILKSAANESFGTINRWNRRKYLKIWDDQIKQLIETKKKII